MRNLKLTHLYDPLLFRRIKTTSEMMWLTTSKLLILFGFFAMVIISGGCGTDQQNKAETSEVDLNALATKLSEDIKKQIITASNNGADARKLSMIYSATDNGTGASPVQLSLTQAAGGACLKTFIIGGAASGVAGAEVLSKACAGIGVGAAVLTGGGSLTIAAACGGIDFIQLDALAGMIVGGVAGYIPGLIKCSQSQLAQFEQSVQSPQDRSIFNSMRYGSKSNEQPASEKQKKQAKEDRIAAARDRREEVEQRKLDQLIGSQAERKEAADARARNAELFKDKIASKSRTKEQLRLEREKRFKEGLDEFLKGNQKPTKSPKPHHSIKSGSKNSNKQAKTKEQLRLEREKRFKEGLDEFLKGTEKSGKTQKPHHADKSRSKNTNTDAKTKEQLRLEREKSFKEGLDDFLKGKQKPPKSPKPHHADKSGSKTTNTEAKTKEQLRLEGEKRLNQGTDKLSKDTGRNTNSPNRKVQQPNQAGKSHTNNPKMEKNKKEQLRLEREKRFKKGLETYLKSKN